jgi:TniQ
MFKTLATKTATPSDRVFAATLASYEGWLFNKPRQCHLPWMLPRYLNIRPHRPFGLQFCPWCLASDKEPYFRRQWRLAFFTLCPIHQTLLLERCQSCGMAVCYEKQTTEEAGTRWLLTQCYRCRTDLRKFAAPRYRTPVNSAELEFAVFLQTVLQRGWVELPHNEVIYSQLFFTGLHQIMRRLTYGRMAQPLKAALYQSYAIELPIDYLPAKSVIFERLNLLQRRTLLQALDRLLQNWPDSFIQFCQAHNLASHFLIGDQKKDLPFWYLRVVCEHLTKGAHKVSDEEIISIVKYVRKEEGQPSTPELNRFLSPQIITRARRAGLIMGKQGKQGKQYPGLCRHCQATQRQFKSGLSRHGTQQFRCGECGRKYQHNYETGRSKSKNIRLSSECLKSRDNRCAAVRSLAQPTEFLPIHP